MSATEHTLRDLLRDAVAGAALRVDATEAAAAGDRRSSRIPVPASAESDALLHGLFERAAPFYLTDRAGHLVAYSRAFAELADALFAPEGDAGGGLDTTPPALMAVIERLYADRRELRRSDTIAGDGENRYFISRHFPVTDSQGDAVGFGGLYEDVTPLARATRKAGDMESWLQDVIRSSSDWLWSVDRNLNLVFASPRISEALGVPAQTLGGRHLFSLGSFDPSDAAAAETRYDMGRHVPFRNRLFLMEDDKGETRRVLLSGVPVFDEATGSFQGYRGTGTDVTRQHQAEERAHTATRELERTFAALKERNQELAVALEQSKVADKAKMDFLAMMSHELKTPLNCIIGFSDAASQKIHGPLDDAYLNYFTDIHEAGRHLLAIISDILDTANIDRQELSVDIVPVRVRDLVTEAMTLVDMKAASRSLDTGKVAPETDVEVLADHLRARQIIMNLLGNAIKFTPDGGEIGVDVTSMPGGKVGITVWDTGVGIPPDEQERVFDRFYQVEKSVLSRGSQGMGLGLSISRYLARLMGGDLTLSSVPGEGARFTLILPRAKEPAARSRRPRATRARKA
jgi:PAS domain S-box-containing protein